MGKCNKMLEEMSFNALFQKLPVGIEVYDGRGGAELGTASLGFNLSN